MVCTDYTDHPKGLSLSKTLDRYKCSIHLAGPPGRVDLLNETRSAESSRTLPNIAERDRTLRSP